MWFDTDESGKGNITAYQAPHAWWLAQTCLFDLCIPSSTSHASDRQHQASLVLRSLTSETLRLLVYDFRVKHGLRRAAWPLTG
ncbi:hypothetical protein FS749_010503 [Ceratobasidium sp. UAMH 11750]|nr:hypothetical protein FS749_010503 [Ceratobasidium sp. UAMH 11750]